MERRRIRHNMSLEVRLANEARQLRERAKTLQPGAERDELLRKAWQAETASHMNEWLNSPGLKPPR